MEGASGLHSPRLTSGVRGDLTRLQGHTLDKITVFINRNSYLRETVLRDSLESKNGSHVSSKKFSGKDWGKTRSAVTR
jgi:hypothetical protein